MDESAARVPDELEDGYRFDAEAVARTLSGQTRAYDELIEKYQRWALLKLRRGSARRQDRATGRRCKPLCEVVNLVALFAVEYTVRGSVEHSMPCSE